MKTPERLLRKAEVLEIYPVSDTEFYNKIRAGEFPEPIRHGRISLWSLHEVMTFVEKLKEGPRGVGTSNVKNRAQLDRESDAA